MDVGINKLLKEIKYDETKYEYFNYSKLEKIKVNKKENSWNIYISNPTNFLPDVLFSFMDCLNAIFKDVKCLIEIKVENINHELINDYYLKILRELNHNNLFLNIFSDRLVRVENYYQIESYNKQEYNMINKELENINKMFNDFGFVINILSYLNKEMQNNIKNEIDNTKKVEVIIEEKSENSKKNENTLKLSFKKKGNNTKYEISNINMEINDICVDAYVFGIDYFEPNGSDLKIITLKITDFKDSMYAKVKIFTSDKEEYQKQKDLLKVGKSYCFSGYVKNDNYAHDLVLYVNKVEEIENKMVERKDLEKEKRVELHTHTFMSQMDAVVSVKSLIKQAKAFGHSAIAITDHNGLQSYPEAYKEKDGIKIIYGVEMNVIDDEVSVVHNLKDYHLIKETYVVFDTETTGFNAGSGDQMIEIGAVKLKDGEIIDRFDELIDPKRPIPSKITELTNITDEMVKGKRTEKDVLTDFMSWVGDLPMVAHNASFDISFIDMGCKKYNLPKFNNTVIDTLELSRMLNPDEFKHNLSILSKRYNVEFLEDSHHRADYDVEATAKIFHKMSKIFLSRGIETIQQIINSIDIEDLLRFSYPYHMTIYAQNKIGLKNLFKLVSLANTKYLHKVPRIPKSEVIKLREGLILGSGCVNGEIFNAAKSKSEEELREMMQFYDFIEVNPPSICEYLIDYGKFTSKMDLIANIKKIIDTALSIDKKVCATGDVHQLNKEDTIYRKIIVNQKIPTVGFHPLHHKEKTIVPNMYFMNTKEMKDEFAFLDDDSLIEDIVVKNPNYIAYLFEEQQIIKDKLYTPVMENSDNITKDMVWDKAREMYGENLPALISERLEKELNGIISNGYSVLYLIAQKLVKKSNEDGYFVGSRGSVGSSLVATMMGITEVNPLPPHYLCPKCKKSIFEINGKSLSLDYKSGYDLPDHVCEECKIPMQKEGQDIPFSSFLGWDAEKVPDIDLNFSSENQAQAHDYTKVLFGEHNVFRAGTIGTVADKTAYGFVKGYCEDNNIMMRNAEIERLAQGITGIKRTTGQHPGGIIVIPDYMDVFDFTPFQYPADDPASNWHTTHFDFHAIHDNVLKLDILGHDDPTMLKALEDLSGIKINDIPFDDKEVLSIFNSPKALGVKIEQINTVTGTLGIPEFGTNFAIKMLEETKPKTFSDLVKVSGLAHGTDVWNGNIRDLIVNKIVTFDKILGCREDLISDLISYGIPGFDAFQITEFVRKNLGNKNQIKFPEKWGKYATQMKEYKVPDWYITSTKKIQYLFPKAHATAYVMMAYRVAWFKVYHPIFYYAAYFSKRCFDFDIESMIKGSDAIKEKIKEITNKGYEATNKEQAILETLKIALEATARGIKFLPIDLKISDSANFIIKDDYNIYPAFSTIDGLGDTVAKNIVNERKIKEFISIEDLQKRTKLSSTLIDKMRIMDILKDLPESNQLTLF